MDEKLNKLQSGIILVKPEDSFPEKVLFSNTFPNKVNQWQKWKRMFKEL